ncbi:MAG: LytTR family transcriptional regulator [Saprospiraceae bacterium]|nr:LytTR family transcriptional regulator [Saprospiraceae bacterium]
MKSTENLLYWPIWKEEKILLIPSKQGYEFIQPSQITYIAAARSYCNIHLINDGNLLVSKSLKQLSNLLPSRYFFRIHHSYLVNVFLIARTNNQDGDLIELKNGEKLPVSQRRKDNFIRFMTELKVR